MAGLNEAKGKTEVDRHLRNGGQGRPRACSAPAIGARGRTAPFAGLRTWGGAVAHPQRGRSQTNCVHLRDTGAVVRYPYRAPPGQRGCDRGRVPRDPDKSLFGLAGEAARFRTALEVRPECSHPFCRWFLRGCSSYRTGLREARGRLPTNTPALRRAEARSGRSEVRLLSRCRQRAAPFAVARHQLQRTGPESTWDHAAAATACAPACAGSAIETKVIPSKWRTDAAVGGCATTPPVTDPHLYRCVSQEPKRNFQAAGRYDEDGIHFRGGGQFEGPLPGDPACRPRVIFAAAVQSGVSSTETSSPKPQINFE
jgi:hypothetical protein